MLQLQILDINQPQRDQHIEIKPEDMYNQECFVGRTSKCVISLPHIDVSRIHGSISYHQGQYYYTDLASRHGSFINNEKLNINHKSLLKENDIIKIVNFLITVQKISLKVESKTENKQIITAPDKTVSVVKNQVESSEVEPKNLDPRQYMELALIPPAEIERWQKGNLKVRCAQIIDETEDVKTFRFVAIKPVLFSYQPGQFVTLNLNIDGKKIKRSYSISSTPSRPHSLEITVKRVPPPADQPDVPQGLVSNWLHDNLQVDDQIEINGPLGKFTCFANPAPKLLFISAGSGITPMMSMSRWASDTIANLDIVFVHSAKTPSDIIYRQELEMMSARQKNFRLAYNITRNQQGQAWSGYIGRLSIPMLESIAPDYQQRTVYVCGPNGFMTAVKDLLKQAGFPMENHYEESFGGAKKSKKTTTVKTKTTSSLPETVVVTSGGTKIISPLETVPVLSESSSSSIPSEPEKELTSTSNVSVVIFKGTGKEVISNNEETVLDLAENEAIEIDYSCRSGSCGTCKIKKLAGEVTYDGEPSALDEDEQEQGYILSCIAIPQGKVTVDETDN